MKKPSLSALSRLVSHALRHEPWLYELELDSEGWVFIEELLTAIRETGPEWAGVGRKDLEDAVNSGEKQRHEIDADRIRALYGHSLPGRIEMRSGVPPEVLFHGTSPESAEVVLQEGLRPMGRQHVHLATDIDMAHKVGKRHSSSPVILTVAAAAAQEQGLSFYVGSDKVWLTDAVPPKFIGLLH